MQNPWYSFPYFTPSRILGGPPRTPFSSHPYYYVFFCPLSRRNFHFFGRFNTGPEKGIPLRFAAEDSLSSRPYFQPPPARPSPRTTGITFFVLLVMTSQIRGRQKWRHNSTGGSSIKFGSPLRILEGIFFHGFCVKVSRLVRNVTLWQK